MFIFTTLYGLKHFRKKYHLFCCVVSYNHKQGYQNQLPAVFTKCTNEYSH